MLVLLALPRDPQWTISIASIPISAARSSTASARPATDVAPLLIIAGAGSGKTNTLAHRVAHLIVYGADPRRIMLLTFSRRAAAEMQRRVERIIGAGAWAEGRRDGDALAWSGTFHAIGARLLREYAARRSASMRPSPSMTAKTPPI